MLPKNCFYHSQNNVTDVHSTFLFKPYKHRRLAIYAAYNSKGRIDNTDLCYLTALTKVADNIIYIADNGLREDEEKKVQNLVCHIEAHRHNEYDFGSYKRGFQYAVSHHLLDDIDELIFCNSSCYAPIHPFEIMFEAMKSRSCDFWGITKSDDISRHLQSFFLVFRSNIFLGDIFNKFMTNITRQASVENVMRQYEIGLSQILYCAGFKDDSYIIYPDANTYPRTKCKNNLTTVPVWLMKQGCPILKKKAFTQQLANLDGVLITRQTALLYNPTLSNCLPSSIKCIFCKVLDFIYKKKITKSGKLLIKFCRIPVYHKTI